MILALLFSGLLSTGSVELETYRTEFINDSRGKITSEDFANMPIVFADLTSPTVGLCWNFFVLGKKVEIDREYWRLSSLQERRALMLHEFGHCVCNLKHSVEITTPFYEGKTFSDGCPDSIMYPYVMESWCFQKHEAEYIEKLMNECQPFRFDRMPHGVGMYEENRCSR